MITVVNDINKLLDIVEPVIPRALSRANEIMGIAPGGTLPEQANRLAERLGIAGSHPAAPGPQSARVIKRAPYAAATTTTSTQTSTTTDADTSPGPPTTRKPKPGTLSAKLQAARKVQTTKKASATKTTSAARAEQAFLMA